MFFHKDVLEQNFEAEAKDLGDDALLQGEEAAEGEAIVNLGSAGSEDDFEALAENDTKSPGKEG